MKKKLFLRVEKYTWLYLIGVNITFWYFSAKFSSKFVVECNLLYLCKKMGKELFKCLFSGMMKKFCYYNFFAYEINYYLVSMSLKVRKTFFIHLIIITELSSIRVNFKKCLIPSIWIVFVGLCIRTLNTLCKLLLVCASE